VVDLTVCDTAPLVGLVALRATGDGRTRTRWDLVVRRDAATDERVPQPFLSADLARLLGSDIHVMLALRRRSRQVVVTNKQFNGPNMVGELLASPKNWRNNPKLRIISPNHRKSLFCL